MANNNPDLRVYELIDFENGCLNSDMVAEVISENDRQYVFDILLSCLWPRYQQHWWPTSDGVYTVRSGYWLARMGHSRTCELYFGALENELRKNVWRLGGSPKLCHFVWRACKGSLAVMEVLFKRHIRPNKNFSLCGANEETIIHSMFECIYAMQIWSHTEFLSLVMEAPRDSFANRFLWITRKVDKKQLCVFASLTWASWFCRNKAIFDAGVVEPIAMTAGFIKLNKYHNLYTGQVRMNVSAHVLSSVNSWSPLPQNCVKINVDAHVSNENVVSFGVVIRDANDKCLVVAVKKISANWLPDLVEAGAARYGLQLTKNLSYDNVVLKSDVLKVVRAIRNKQVGLTPFFLIFDEVRSLSGEFNWF